MSPFIPLFLFPKTISFKIGQCFPKTGFLQQKCLSSMLPPPPLPSKALFYFFLKAQHEEAGSSELLA